MVYDKKVYLEPVCGILVAFVSLGKIGHRLPEVFMPLEIYMVSRLTETDLAYNGIGFKFNFIQRNVAFNND